jgi:multidrug efflux pump subunit AcrA (membrane-fusion protein)
MTGRPLSAVLLLVAAGCFSGYSEDSPPSHELKVRRGTFGSSLTISGELEAARGDVLSVPPLPQWQTSIKWLADEGTMVHAGEQVVELDNSSLTSDLDQKRQTETQAVQEMQQREAEWSADLQQKMLDAEKQQSELEKAELNAAIPKDVLAARKYEEYQTMLLRSRVGFDKARDLLASRRKGIDSERANLILRIDKARREIMQAETGINALVLRAPRDGIVVGLDHPWEGRKMQPGDTVFVGFPIAMMPDLTTLRVLAALPDVDDGRIAIGQRATVTLDGYPDQRFPGRVTAISAVARESRRQSLRRNFDVLIALDQLDPTRMRPGLSARVVIYREAAPNVLLAPRAALDFSARQSRAVLANGTSVDVTVGSCNPQECVVIKGLEEGQKLGRIVGVRRG